MYRGYDLILSFIIVMVSISLITSVLYSSTDYRIREINDTSRKKVAVAMAYMISNMIRNDMINITELIKNNVSEISFDELNIPKPVEYGLPYGLYVIIDIYNVKQPKESGELGYLDKIWVLKIYVSPSSDETSELSAYNSVVTSNGYYVMIKVYTY